MANKSLNVSTKFTAVDKFSRKVEGMTKTTKKFANSTQNGFARIQRGSRKVTRATDRFGRIGNQAFKGVGIAAGAAATGIVAMTQKISENIATAKRFTDFHNMSIKTFRRLEFAAQQYGVSQDAVMEGLKELQNRTAEFAAVGSGPGADAFRQLGISAKELNTVKDDAGALFKMIRNELSNVESAAQRQFLADALFGGQGAEQMKKFLSASGAEIDKFMKQADKAGFTVGNKTANQMVKFNQKMQRMKAIFSGLGVTVTSEVIPIMSEYSDKIMSWIKGNRELISTKIKSFIKGVADALQFLSENSETIIRTTKIFIGTLLTLKAVNMAARATTILSAAALGTYNVVLGITSALSGKAAIALNSSKVAMAAYHGTLKVATVVQKGFNMVMRANPIGLVITAIMALIAGIVALVKHWDTVKATMMGVWEVIKSVGKIIKIWFISPIKFLVKLIQGLGQVLKYVFTGQFGKAIEAGKKTFGSLKDQVVSDAKEIKKTALGMGEDFQRGFDEGKGRIRDKQQINQLRKQTAMIAGGGEQRQALNRDAQNQQIQTQREERIRNDRLTIGINDNSGRATVDEDTGGYIPETEGTLGF